jgi:hypothetical protein
MGILGIPEGGGLDIPTGLGAATAQQSIFFACKMEKKK